VLAELVLPSTFVADAVAVWDCTSACLAGVPTWREVARIQLGGASDSSRLPRARPDVGMVNSGGAVGIAA